MHSVRIARSAILRACQDAQARARRPRNRSAKARSTISPGRRSASSSRPLASAWTALHCRIRRKARTRTPWRLGSSGVPKADTPEPRNLVRPAGLRLHGRRRKQGGSKSLCLSELWTALDVFPHVASRLRQLISTILCGLNLALASQGAQNCRNDISESDTSGASRKSWCLYSMASRTEGSDPRPSAPSPQRGNRRVEHQPDHDQRSIS